MCDDPISGGVRPTPAAVFLEGLGSIIEVLVNPTDARISVTGITHDSRRVLPGDLYVALPGEHVHGAQFVLQASSQGAVAILTDAAGADRSNSVGLPVFVVSDPRAVLGEVSSWVYADPAADMLMIGITGTNGKTTMSYLVDAGLLAADLVTGVIGTVGTRIGDDHVPSARTTPEATDLYALLAVMRERGVSAVVMEVSSHALVLGRVGGLTFDVVVFSNLSQDHLDFHGDMESYFVAKMGLFSPERAVTAVICVDDGWGQRLLADIHIPAVSYALDRPADWTVEGVVTLAGGTVMRAVNAEVLGQDSIPLEVRMPGRFNAANALGALAALHAAGIDPLVAADGIAACEGVPGRMQRVDDPDHSRGLLAIVDYAHTPDAVERALTAAAQGTSGQVIVVLGCGGDRDRDKRPAMGAVASQLAQIVIVTDDNPRSEDPALIRAAIVSGAKTGPATLVEIGERAEAIQEAVRRAKARDVVLVLGKGHEQGQEVLGVSHAFDDREVLAAALELAVERPRATGAGVAK